jgi:hypothetical protein
MIRQRRLVRRSPRPQNSRLTSSRWRTGSWKFETAVANKTEDSSRTCGASGARRGLAKARAPMRKRVRKNNP